MRNFIKSRRFLAFTAVAGAVTLSTIAVPAKAALSAQAVAGNNDLTPGELAQQNSPAYQLAHQITAAAGYSMNDDSAGYARARYDVDANSVDLWWKGNLSQDVQKMVDSARTSGVLVTIHPAQHTRYFMTMRSGLFNNNSALVSEGIDVQSVTMPDDMSGYDVTVAKSSRTAAQTDSATKQFGAAATGLPIHSVTETDGPTGVPAAGSRPADTTPWKAGGEQISTTYDSAGDRHFCSTGFAVNDHGKDALLSAAHCDTNVSSPVLGWYNGTYTTLAHNTDTSTTPTLDSMVLDTVGGTTGSMYSGSYTSSGTYPVAGSQANNVGDWVRTSGANSGTHYSIQITAVDYERSCEFNAEQHTNYWCYYGAVAAQPNGTPGSSANMVVAQGDSGGPVYTTVNAPTGKVDAKGIISAAVIQPAPGMNLPPGNYQIANCDAVEAGQLAYPPAGGTICSTAVVYQEINPVLNTTGVTLKTQ